jgi:hypothetical protein
MVRVPVEVGKFSPYRIQTGSGAHPSKGYHGLFPWGKAVGLEVDHSPPSSFEVKNAWSSTSIPQHAVMVWCSDKKSTGTLPLY